jgi:hypothetical protein
MLRTFVSKQPPNKHPRVGFAAEGFVVMLIRAGDVRRAEQNVCSGFSFFDSKKEENRTNGFGFR